MKFAYPRKPRKGEPIRAELICEIIDCLRANTPIQGPNIRVSYTTGGAIIAGTPGGAPAATATEIAPWTVRRHDVDGDAQWEIYLPGGCMSVGLTLEPLNKPANEGDGHDDEDAEKDWYILPLKEKDGSETYTTTETDSEGQQQTVRVWEYNVVAHAKTSAKVKGVDGLDDAARGLLWVDAKKHPNQQDQQDQTDAKSVAGTWGDEYSQTVAVVRISLTGSGEYVKESRKITQLTKNVISVHGQGPSSAMFALVWYFDFDSDNDITVDKVYCVKQSLSVAGMTLQGPSMTDVTGAEESIYAKILTNPLNPSAGSGTVEIVKDPRNMIPGNYMTWLKLYGMKANAVTSDHRWQSLTNLMIYRG